MRIGLDYKENNGRDRSMQMRRGNQNDKYPQGHSLHARPNIKKYFKKQDVTGQSGGDEGYHRFLSEHLPWERYRYFSHLLLFGLCLG